MTPLEKILIEKIAAHGPLNIEAFMSLALGHPERGYYITRDPLGRGGDFTTAPEISQMFGELIGLWCADLWMQIGRPAKFILAEAGPGRGTLMADLMRAGRSVPGFIEAAEIHLIETSPALREKQAKALEGFKLRFHDTLDGLKTPQGPVILIANELLDALPVRQFAWIGTAWKERAVGFTEGAGFRYVWIEPPPDATNALPQNPQEGEIYETGAVRDAFVKDAAALTKQGGAALFIDYGHTKSAPGDTLQAVRDHRFHNALEMIGEADLTAHVDFETAARAARDGGAHVFGPVTQGRFLLALGLSERTQALINAVSARLRDGPEAQNAVQDIKSAALRLSGPAGMGQLFKVLCVSHDKTLRPSGF